MQITTVSREDFARALKDDFRESRSTGFSNFATPTRSDENLAMVTTATKKLQANYGTVAEALAALGIGKVETNHITRMK